MTKLPSHFKCGINLGNSLDAVKEGAEDTEICWGNPRTTKPMIQMFADAGFDILRLPVTWGPHMKDTPDWTVDPTWLSRVEQVVNWGLEANMTVILNTHHERWIKPELSQLTELLPRYQSLWQQIAEYFKGYGEELIFQGSNEPNLPGGENCATGSGNRNVRAAINALNHTFVRTVRESGGANSTRWLCIPGLAARPLPDCMRDMIMPEDEKLIYTIHCYSPDRFVFQRNDQSDTAFFDEKARDEVREMFEDIKRYALPHGLPVMITEFGAVTKLLPDGIHRNDEERIKFVKTFLECASALDIPCVWWDNNYFQSGDEHFGLFDREGLRCHSPQLVEACVQNARAPFHAKS